MGTDFWGHPTAPPEAAKPRTPDVPSPAPPLKTGGGKEGAGNSAASTGNDDTKAPGQTAPPPEKIEDLQAELEGYIGLTAIKKEVKNLINMVTVYQMRKDHGLPTTDLSLHMLTTVTPVSPSP